MIYAVTLYGDPVLRKVAKDIDTSYPELKKLIDDLFETMYNADGVGIAAPQIGLNDRIFVVDLTGAAEEHPEYAEFKKAFINPHIIEKDGDKELMQEGCLSIPGIHEDVLRYNRIRIKYFDSDWNEHDEVYTGFAARVLQHEYDHLDGIMFVDYCSPLKRRLLKGKLMDITKGKTNATYRVRVPKIN